MSRPDSGNSLKKILYALSSLNDLGRVMTSNGSFDEIIKAGLYVILGTLSSSRGAILHYETESSSMEILAKKGLGELQGVSFPLSQNDLLHLLEAPRMVDLRKPQEELAPFLRRHSPFLGPIHASFMSPLKVGDQLVGILLVGERFGGGEYAEEDLQILSMMARQLSVALFNHRLFSSLQIKMEENRALYTNLRQIYQDTIQAFAAAIDAKDEYTRGHSARVAQYAVAIGEALELSEDELEGLRLAGLLHDIGKISVDSSIIRKTSTLDDHEVMAMHKHPSIGYDILSNIKFPWGDLSMLARHHHETVDGKGYPDGLRGDDLMLGARIITLADSFDAMTSDRPYRKEIGLEETLLEIRRCTGTQFDAEVVDALLHVLEGELSGTIPLPKIIPHLSMNYDKEKVLHALREAEVSSEFAGGKSCARGQSPRGEVL